MLLTKLHIPIAANDLVQRTDIYEKLNIGLNRKLILISAPAGFGKTTLISDWISYNNIPTAWFSIDKGDNDPVEFLNYIISGIQSIHSPFGQSALKLLNSPNKPTNKSITNLLINEILQIQQNFLLLLDDFHLINNPEILELVSYLLDHIPNNIHIVILTRSDLSLPASADNLSRFVGMLSVPFNNLILPIKHLQFSTNGFGLRTFICKPTTVVATKYALSLSLILYFSDMVTELCRSIKCYSNFIFVVLFH